VPKHFGVQAQNRNEPLGSNGSCYTNLNALTKTAGKIKKILKVDQPVVWQAIPVAEPGGITPTSFQLNR